jgi:hypothetical protein
MADIIIGLFAYMKTKNGREIESGDDRDVKCNYVQYILRALRTRSIEMCVGRILHKYQMSVMRTTLLFRRSTSYGSRSNTASTKSNLHPTV